MRYLREIEWGRDGFASRWWPESPAAGSGVIVVDPRRGFGSSVIAGTGIRVEDIFSRFAAGEPIHELAEDYGRSVVEIEAAIRFEAKLLESLAA